VSVCVDTYCWKLVLEVFRPALMLAETGPHPADADALSDVAIVSVLELVSWMPVVDV
jgi:hypothetical protein